MALKKVVVLGMAALFLLVAVSTSVSAARADHHVLDMFELLSATNQDYSKSSAVRVVRGKNVNEQACCDSCVCTRSIPPQCRCTDTFTSTDRCKGCDVCICALSYPPICRCVDTTNSCSPPCSSSTTISANEAASFRNKNYVASN